MASIVAVDGVTRANAYRIPVEKLEQNEDSRRWSDTDIAELARDIADRGQLLPVLVRWDKTEKGHERLVVVAGRRRVAAIRYINANGMNIEEGNVVPLKVLCMPFAGEPHEAFVAAAAENIKRKNLTPIDLAFVIATMEKQGGKRKDISKILEISEPLISQTLKLLTLPLSVQKDIHNGKISASAGYEMANLNLEDQARAATPKTRESQKQPEEATTLETPKPPQDAAPTRESIRQVKREKVERGEAVAGSIARSRKVVYSLFSDWAGCEDGTIEDPIKKLCADIVAYFDGRKGDRAVLNRMRDLAGE